MRLCCSTFIGAVPALLFACCPAGKVTKLGRSFARSRDYDAMGEAQPKGLL